MCVYVRIDSCVRVLDLLNCVSPGPDAWRALFDLSRPRTLRCGVDGVAADVVQRPIRRARFISRRAVSRRVALVPPFIIASLLTGSSRLGVIRAEINSFDGAREATRVSPHLS